MQVNLVWMGKVSCWKSFHKKQHKFACCKGALLLPAAFIRMLSKTALTKLVTVCFNISNWALPGVNTKDCFSKNLDHGF